MPCSGRGLRDKGEKVKYFVVRECIHRQFDLLETYKLVGICSQYVRLVQTVSKVISTSAVRIIIHKLLD